jgi:signal peptidase II
LNLVGGVSLQLRAWLRAGAVMVLVLVADQVSKAVVRADIAPGERDEVLSFLHLVRVRNTGVAFGALAGAGGIIVAVLVAVAVVALLAYFATHQDRRLIWLPTGMLLGGAIGNVADRIRSGGVTDFIKVPHWPAFNVADIAITLGVIVLLLVIEVGERGSGNRPG